MKILNALKTVAISLPLVLMLSACSGGGGSDSSTPVENTHIGVFLDSTVEGVKYKTSSGVEGYTNNKGEYQFKDGDTVEFLVGNISLGNIQAKELISVLELESPKESALILQSLDTDGNPNNGINISKETFKLFENSTIDIKDVSINNSKFTSEYKDLTNNEFKLSDKTVMDHAHYSMMLENLKSIGGNLYAYYEGHIDIYNKYDKQGLKVNKNKLQAYSNRRLQLYYFNYFISPELNLNTAYQYNKLKNQEEAHKAVEKFLSNTATATNEVVALTDLDPTNLQKHIVDRSLNYAKGIALKDGLSKKEDKFASNPSISNASQIAMHRAMVNIDSCKGIYQTKDPIAKAKSVTACASSLLFDGANILNDGYMAYNYYSSVKESNTIQLVRAYLEEYFNSAGDINFMYARYGVTTEEAFVDALKKSVLTPSVVFWSNGDYSIDNELFTSLIEKYKIQALEKVNIMKDTYGLKSNFDALDISVVTPEITKSKYDVETDKFTVCYRVNNDSYFDVKDINLNLEIKDESSVLVSKNIQLMNMNEPHVTDEQCLDFSHNTSLDLSAGNFVSVVSEIGYNIEDTAHSFTSSQDLYFTQSNLFDLLKKIAPPVIELDLVTNRSKDEDLFFTSAKNSSVDASQGTLSFTWKQIDIDGYTLLMSGDTSPDITITTPKLPQGITQNIVWVEVTAIASISKKETVKTFKIIVDSSQETLVELPKAYAGEDVSVVQGSTVTFTAQNSNENYDGDIEWYWIDDTNEVISTEKSFEKSFEKAGIYKFKLEAYKPSLSDTSSIDEIIIIVGEGTNQTPTATALNLTTDENQNLNVTLLGTDEDGDTLTYTIVENPSNGTLSGTAPNLTYTPTTDYNGTDSFTYKVNDGTVDSVVETVNITINTIQTSSTSSIKKTGQTKSYDVNGTEVTNNSLKDDGYYQKGVTPDYTRASGMVADELTGLMWQDDYSDNDGNITSKQWLTDENYDICNNDTSSPACYDTSGDTASTYCSELTLGGYTDWRLPADTELEGIVDYGRHTPAIDTSYFTKTGTATWSRTTANNEKGAVNVYIDGQVLGSYKNANISVRCVRKQF